MALEKCPALKEDQELYHGPYPVAKVGPLPLAEKPLPSDEIVGRFGNNPSPLLLAFDGRRACAYAVPSSSDSADLFSPATVFDPKFQNAPPLFGIPTLFRFPARKAKGLEIFYDTQRRRFFGKEKSNGRLFQIGDPKNLDRYLASIEAMADGLEGKGELRPEKLASLSIFQNGEAKKIPLPPAAAVEKRMEDFLQWLKGFDPALWQDVYYRLRILIPSSEKPSNAVEACEESFVHTSYASFQRDTGTIYVHPMGIQLLMEEDFEVFAQVLAHERAHQRVLESGLVPPSGEILNHAVDFFLNRTAERNLFDFFLIALFRDDLERILQCRLMPLVFEEEIQAFGNELGYAKEKRLESKTEELQREAHDIRNALTQTLERHIPENWRKLSLEYIATAETIHRQADPRTQE